MGIWERSGATRKQCLGGREAQWPGMKKNITRLLFRRAFFTQKGSSTCGAIKSCAMTTRGRTAVPRGLLRVLGTLALPVLGTLKEYPPGNILVPFVYLRVLRVPSGYLRVPSGYSSTQSSQISQFAFLRVHWLPHCRGIPRQCFFSVFLSTRFPVLEYPCTDSTLSTRIVPNNGYCKGTFVFCHIWVLNA